MQKKNKFKKNFSKDDININDLINKENLINPYSNIDFYKFLVKFCGSFIYRGKKSYSYKLYDYFLYNLKNNFKKNPIKIFSKIIKNLMPFLIVGKKSFKGKLLFMPILAKGNKKNVLIINSLIRQLKGKSYTNGVIKGDVLRVLIDTYNLKGSALNLKKDHYIEALKVRRNIKTSSHLYKVVKK